VCTIAFFGNVCEFDVGCLREQADEDNFFWRESKMKRSTTRRMKPQGFTLVEMLIVLAILVGLAALVVPRILGTQKKADINNTKAQIGMLKGCLNQYHLDMKRFPSTEEGLNALIQEPTMGADDGTGTGTAVTSNWSGPYTETGELPRDPWGGEFRYEYPPTHGKADFPDIWSAGPDGEDGTEDDICSWTKGAGEGGQLEDQAGGYEQYDEYENVPSDM